MTTPETLPEVITIDELAAMLRVSLPTAYSAVQRGKVPGAVKIGRVWRLHRPTVVSWLAQGCVPGRGGKPCP
jgi:excisionase family DNA binding protein